MITDLSLDTIHEYFATINPIASKISVDISETKSSYEHIWDELNFNEQIDIINETLIKPEISLRYYDSFSSSSSSSSLVSFIEENYHGTNKNDAKLNKLLNSERLNVKNIYAYNGKNLSTYSVQKTGLKTIKDDVSGKFRDEHSIPFSFRTKSQINLRIFDNNNLCSGTDSNYDGQFLKKLFVKSTTNATSNYDDSISTSNKRPIPSSVRMKIFQKAASPNRMKSTDLDNIEKEIKVLPPRQEEISIGKNDGKYERLIDEMKSLTEANQRTSSGNIETEKNTSTSNKFLPKFLCKNNLFSSSGSSAMKSSTTSATAANQALRNICTNVDLSEDNDECSGEEQNLMMNVCYSGLTPSLSIPSETSEDDYDIKIQTCEEEDSKLLLKNDDLLKGFDFLNNW